MGPGVDVTIVVPCYNTERFLDQALSSAQQNGSCTLEILAMDDGSTDGSLRVMRSHAARDARVRVTRKPNEGYGATVNRGIREARGTYVAILEPDDYVVPGAYDALFRTACEAGQPDVVKAPYWRVLSRGGADSWRAYGYLRGRVRATGTFRLADAPQLIQYHPSVWSALYRRDFLQREDVRFVEAPGAGWVDNAFSVDALAAARSIAFTNEAYYCYREDLAGASSACVPARVMIDRWNERQDALERRGQTSPEVLRANYVVALRFFERMFAEDALASDDLLARAQAMARRMDPKLVGNIACVPPSVVEGVLRLAGASGHAPSAARYGVHLAREAWWALRTNGMPFLAHNLMLARKS